MTRHVIIGTGVAAIAAAEAIRAAGDAAEILIVGDDSHGYYSRPGLAYYLTDEVTPALLSPYPAASYDKLRARTLQGHVSRIDPSGHAVEINGTVWELYDRLLIAAGASAVPLKVPGAELNGVLKLDHFEDARALVRLARRAKAAVVVGGGITALELVEGLHARGIKVHYVMRGERYWGNVLDETESRVIERRLQHDGVVLHYNSEVLEIQEKTGILGKTGSVGAVRTNRGDTIPCQLVAYAIGVLPRTELARACGLACEKGVLTNEYMQTSAADVYAAGDVAQVFDPALGRSVIDSLWGPAREQGNVAGLNMAGRPTAYVKRTPFNVTRLAGLTTTIIGTVGSGHDLDVRGIARGDSETWREIPNATVAREGMQVNRVRVMVGEKTLLGAIIMGDQKLSPVLETLIRDRVDIGVVRDRLLSPGAEVVEVLSNFWSEWRRQHAS